MRMEIYLFEIGNGIEKPANTSLKTIFKTDNVTEANGKYTISVPINKIRDIMPTIYQDTRGGLWYIDPLIEGFYLPEICLHYLINTPLSLLVKNDIFFRFCIDIQLIMDIQLIYQPTTSHT